MKKALMLAGVLLCGSTVFSAETPSDKVAEGKKRNEEVIEKMLEQTGWKNEKAARGEKPVNPNIREGNPTSSQPKSS